MMMFTGLRFFLHRLRPAEAERYNNILTSNGGTVEAYLGRQNVIAVVQDNFNPDNVSSWDLLSRCIPTRWIDDCLEADALLPFDGYRFSQPSPAAQRKRGAQRSAYTKEEDKLIYSLVRAEFRKTGGGGLKGMKLFKSIEDKIPGRKYHSIRERFIKKILPRLPDVDPFSAPTLDITDDGADELTHAEEGKDSAAQQLSPNREQTNMHHKSPEQREAFNSGEESDSLLEEDDLETLRLLHSGKKLHATLQTNPLNDSPPVSPVPQHQQRRRLHKSSESVSGPIDHHRLPDLQSRCQSASELLAVAPEVIMSTLFEVSGNWKLLVKTIVYYGKDSMDSRMLRFNHRDDVIIMNSVFPALDRRPVPPAGDQFEENYETMDQMIEKRGAARVEYRVRFLQTVVDEVESVLLTVS